MENCNTILTEKQEKYQHYHPKKLIKMNINVKKYCLLIGQNRCTYSPLRKAFEKHRKTIEEQGRKQVDAIKNKSKRKTSRFNQ